MRVAHLVPGLALVALLGGCVPPAQGETAVTDAWDAGKPVSGYAWTSGSLVTLERQADGDSFTASDGIEYRVGLVNTPEVGECWAAEATAATAAFLADGFVTEPYDEDRYGRVVARVRTEDGDLGVFLARNGFADDRYLEDFRDENPAYAAELDEAFALARAAGAGLWSACDR